MQGSSVSILKFGKPEPLILKLSVLVPVAIRTTGFINLNCYLSFKNKFIIFYILNFFKLKIKKIQFELELERSIPILVPKPTLASLVPVPNFEELKSSILKP